MRGTETTKMSYVQNKSFAETIISSPKYKDFLPSTNTSKGLQDSKIIFLNSFFELCKEASFREKIEQYQKYSSWSQDEIKKEHVIFQIVRDIEGLIGQEKLAQHNYAKMTAYFLRRVIEPLPRVDIHKQNKLYGYLEANEETVVNKLLAEKATIIKNDLNVPNYSSWAEISPGIKLSLERENYQFEYIPSKLLVENAILPLNQVLDSLCSVKPGKTVSYFTNSKTRQIGQKVFDSLLLGNVNFEKNHWFDIKVWVPTRRKVNKKSYVQKKVEHTQGDIYDVFALLANHAHGVDNIKEFLTIQKYQRWPFCHRSGHLFDIHISPAKKIKSKFALKHSQGMYRKNLTTDLPEETLKVIKQLIHNDCFTYEIEENDDTAFGYTNNSKQIYCLLNKFMESHSLPALNTQQQYALHNMLNVCSHLWNVQGKLRISDTNSTMFINNAPHSERGKLQVLFDDSLDIEQVKKDMWNFGVGDIEVCDQEHIEYDEQTVKLPKNNFIIHGMTGAKTTEGAYQRIVQMMKHKGLLSQSLRRELDVNIHSLSPLGDIASGLDWAVPATINTKPCYGNHIFFVIHPKAINRKQLFFSPKDFGGGKSRFKYYDDYAKFLGQKGFQSPICHQHKQRHINIQKNLPENDKRFNEVWFKDIVPWSEITYIVVNEHLHSLVKNLLEDNPITQHIKIVSYDAEMYESEKETYKKVGQQLKFCNLLKL